MDSSLLCLKQLLSPLAPIAEQWAREQCLCRQGKHPSQAVLILRARDQQVLSVGDHGDHLPPNLKLPNQVAEEEAGGVVAVLGGRHVGESHLLAASLLAFEESGKVRPRAMPTLQYSFECAADT